MKIAYMDKTPTKVWDNMTASQKKMQKDSVVSLCVGKFGELLGFADIAKVKEDNDLFWHLISVSVKTEDLITAVKAKEAERETK